MAIFPLMEENRAPCSKCRRTLPIALLECPVDSPEYVCYAMLRAGEAVPPRDSE